MRIQAEDRAAHLISQEQGMLLQRVKKHQELLERLTGILNSYNSINKSEEGLCVFRGKLW